MFGINGCTLLGKEWPTIGKSREIGGIAIMPTLVKCGWELEPSVWEVLIRPSSSI